MATTAKVTKQLLGKLKYPTQYRNRCQECGRPRGFLRLFGLCRLCFPSPRPQRRVARSHQSIMVRDPLSDLVSRIKNGYMASLGSITMPKSKLREAVLKILSSEKYVGKVTSDDQGLTVELYKSKTPVITEIVRVSKPGSRVYMGFKSLRLVLGGMGIQILSTP